MTWIVAADVVATEDIASDWRRFVLGGVEELREYPTYVSWETYETPSLPTSDGRLAVDLHLPELGADLLGRRVVMLLHASGTPEQLVAGEGEIPVLLVLDEAWDPIDAGPLEGLVGAAEALLPDYGHNLAGVISLVDDAKAARQLRDEISRQELAYNATAAELDKWSDQIEAGLVEQFPLAHAKVETPGPLGDWRRAQGWEVVDGVSAGLEWLDLDVDQRQLPVVEEDRLPAVEEAASLGDWLYYRIAVETTPLVSQGYSWVGVKAEGVGLLGPFFLDGAVVEVSGFAPPVELTLVAWRGVDPPLLQSAEPVSALAFEPEGVFSGAPVVLWMDLNEGVQPLNEYEYDQRRAQTADPGLPSELDR